MTRKLASVRRVAEIIPIEGADNIELAKIDGWQCVTQKGWCEPGNLVCFFEVDSFLPVHPEFEFLRKSGFRSHPDLGDGFRLKTIKLRGQLSQGLIMPLAEVLAGDVLIDNYRPDYTWEEGDDLTDIIGVKLYEKPLPRNMAGKVRGNFPSFIPKTDQERVQNILKYLPEHLGRKYQATLKLHGSSMTIYARSALNGVVIGEFGAEPNMVVDIGMCSRNLDLKLDDESPSLYLRTFQELALGEKLHRLRNEYGGDIAIQGEMMGPGIQGNRERFDGLRFFVFDMFDITKQIYLDPVITENYARTFGFDHVPVIDYISLSDLWDDADHVSRFLEYAERPSINHDIAEGVVFKAIGGSRHSFKVLNNTFLLKEKD